MSEMYEAAQRYAKRGWHVFPLKPRSKYPFKGTHGHKDATTDPAPEPRPGPTAMPLALDHLIKSETLRK